MQTDAIVGGSDTEEHSILLPLVAEPAMPRRLDARNLVVFTSAQRCARAAGGSSRLGSAYLNDGPNQTLAMDMGMGTATMAVGSCG